MPKVKAQLEKLSTAWDLLGLASYQMRLLDDEEVSNGPELEQKTKAYEEGDQMIKDFIGWIKAEYSPDDIVVEEEKKAGDDGDKVILHRSPSRVSERPELISIFLLHFAIATDGGRRARVERRIPVNERRRC
jgi:hypothetical protein